LKFGSEDQLNVRNY